MTGPAPVETFHLNTFFRFVCEFRLYSTKLANMRLSRTRACCTLGSAGNPFDRVWPPTTSGDLQPIFSCVDSRGTHPYVCMYVSMVCGMYVGMYWVRRESTQVHREGGTVSSKGNEKCSVCDYDDTSSQGAVYVRRCSGASLSEVWVVFCG